MNQESMLKREYQSEQDWLKDIFRKSNSLGSRNRAETSLRVFDMWCKYKLEIPDPDISDLEMEYQKTMKGLFSKDNSENGKLRWQAGLELEKAIKARFDPIYAQARAQIISKYTDWFEQNRVDVQSICTSLNKFVAFCGEEHPEIRVTRHASFKAKQGGTIRGYFSDIKHYLRKCHGVRITTDDVKDFISFPKDLKQAREPIELETLKLLLEYSPPERRALYYVLLTSGMRDGEGLSLKRSNFNVNVRPIEIHLRAEDTKGNEARDTYISEEAWERVKPIYDRTEEGQYLFHDYNAEEYKIKAVRDQSRFFDRLRKKIAEKTKDKLPCDEFPEGTGILKHYEKSNRYVVQIHAFRAWFMTKASLKHGDIYSHALSGHASYLKQYERIPKKQRPKMYLELEKDLLLQSAKIASEQFHEQEVAELQEAMAEQQKQIEKLMRVNSTTVNFDATRLGVTS